MSNCLLTVSIATYNVEKYIRNTLESFVDLDIEEGLIEVLIINDGSTDSSVDIAKEYENKYPLTFRVINKENGGWGSTVNTGLANANGKYFKLLDGDDYYCKDSLKGFIELLKSSEVDLIVTPYYTFSDLDGKILEKFEYRNFEGCDNDVIREYLDRLELLQMHSICIKTELIRNRISVLENCFYTDTEFMVKALSFCNTLSYYGKPIYFYRLARAGQSMSLEGFRKHYQEHEKVIFSLLEYIEKADLESDTFNVLKKRIIMMTQAHYGFLMMLKDKKIEIRDFDKRLKNNTSVYYDITSIKIRLLRVTHFSTYKIMCVLQKAQEDRKNRKLAKL